jgi:hypothetical protein
MMSRNWITLLAALPAVACSAALSSATVEGSGGAQPDGLLAMAARPDAGSHDAGLDGDASDAAPACPAGGIKVTNVRASHAGGPVGDAATCSRAWRSLEAERGANAKGDPFPMLAPDQTAWGRVAAAGAEILVTTPGEYDTFDVETCPSAPGRPSTTTACSVPTSWRVDATKVAVGMHPTWKRVDKVYKTDAQGQIVLGQQAYGGVNTMFKSAGVVTPYSTYLNWALYSEAPEVDATRARALLGIPAQQAVTVAPFTWASVAGLRTVGISFGATRSLEGRMWGLAGRGVHDSYELHPGQDLGFANFGSRSEEGLTTAEYAAKHVAYSLSDAIAWDPVAGNYVPCEVSYDVPYAEQCQGVLTAHVERLRRTTLAANKPLCATVLWTSDALGTYATSACITPKGEVQPSETVAVSLEAMRILPVDYIDQLPPNQ